MSLLNAAMRFAKDVKAGGSVKRVGDFSIGTQFPGGNVGVGKLGNRFGGHLQLGKRGYGFTGGPGVGAKNPSGPGRFGASVGGYGINAGREDNS